MERLYNNSIYSKDCEGLGIALIRLNVGNHKENKLKELEHDKIKNIVNEVNKNELQNNLYPLIEKYNIYDSNSLNSLAKSMEKNFWKNELKDSEGKYTRAMEMVSRDIEHINQNLSIHYKRMLYINVFIVIDEYLRKILKYLYMYNIDWIKDKRLLLSIEEITNKEKFEELKENLIDEFTNEYNIEEKIKRINWIIRNKFELEPFNDEFLKEIKVYRIERNSLVHSEGVILEKYINDLIKIDAKVFKDIKKGESFIYEIKKTKKMINLFRCYFHDLETIILEKVEKDIFGEILYFNRPKVLDIYMNQKVFKKYSEFVE